MKLHEVETIVVDNETVSGESVMHQVSRRIVPGGWLYTTVVGAQTSKGLPTLGVSTTFVPGSKGSEERAHE